MSYNFEQENNTEHGNPIMHIKTDDGVKIEFLFCGIKLIEFYMDGFEEEPFLEHHAGVYVKIDGEFVSLYNLCMAAEDQFEI